MSRRTLIRTVLRRGWSKRCPHCGRGLLYAGWVRALDRCSHCGLVYERNPGDSWFFLHFIDRFPIAGLIAFIYFGIHRADPVASIFLFAAVSGGAIWTTPNRWGLCTALNYLSRVLLPSPDDPVPGPTMADEPR